MAAPSAADLELAFVEKFFWSQGREPYPVQEQAIGAIIGGQSVLVTVPTGYHPHFDGHLLNGSGATRAATLVRSGSSWRQTKTLTAKPYGASSPWAESVWIGEYERSVP